MDISLDYRNLFKILNRHRVKYLIVGAYAVVYYAEPRFTKDLDLWVKADIKNAEKLYKALKQFGAPLRDICLKDFTNKHMVYQIGIAPIRVDIIMGLPGISFDSAWKNRVRSKYEDTQINIVGIKDLMKSKEKTGRIQDRLDLDRLKANKKQAM